MKPYTFTAPFKPEGAKYTKLCLWNRYLRTPFYLILLMIPSALGIYFLANNDNPYFIPVYVLLVCYPLINLLIFLVRIKKHLRFRSKADEATTHFTVMENGILTERPEISTNYLYHWNEFTNILDIKDHLLLFNKDVIVLILQKEFIPKEDVSAIRNLIAEHLYTKEDKKAAK
ncbi:MAG: YcxB family protein [Lachnospiraceae bacterium]|nr:YcxB family protein [Lachnospiraceae bacterium]